VDADEIRLLYTYNGWANARILAAAAALTPEQLHEELRTSFGSVFGTLAHILWAEWRWLARWLVPAPGPGPDPLAAGDLPVLRVRWTEVERAQAEFLRVVTERDLHQRVTYENPPGTTWTYPLGQMLQHVVNHSTYHRGQVTAMLRQVGAGTVATDFLVFIDEREAAATSRARGGA